MTRQELINEIFTKKSFLCVGLDTDVRKLPPHLLTDEDPVFAFNRQIIDATAPYCVAYKPNLAFYESGGVKGMTAFEKTIRYLKTHYPHHFIIADAKRGDIGNTSALYARTFFEEYDVDSLTVAPYMGEDSVKPFLAYPDKWVILLVLTSNKGASDFQMICGRDGESVYQHVLSKSMRWSDPDHLMFVVGATRGEMFKDIRRIASTHFLLVPGVGAQGGSLKEVCRYGMTHECGLLVNSSRGIIYASNGEDFAERAAEQAHELQQQMSEELSIPRAKPTW